MPKKITSKLLGKALKANQTPVFSNAADAFYDVLPENHGFVTSLQLDEFYIPSLMIKLSTKWADLVASGTHGFIDPQFTLAKLIDGQGDGDVTFLATINLQDERKLHFPLDPAHPLVEHFFRLLEESRIFAITLRRGSDPLKFSIYTEVDSNWKPILKNALETIKGLPAENDYRKAVAANQVNFAPDEKHRVLDFMGSTNPKVLAENNEDDINLSVEQEGDEFVLNLEWLAKTHDIYLTEDPPYPSANVVWDKINAIFEEIETMEPAQMINRLLAIEKSHPGNTDVLKLIYRSYWSNEQYAEATEVLDLLKKVVPDSLMPILLELKSITEPEEFLAAMENFPKPLEINLHPKRDKVIYSVDFVDFENIAIRYACMNNDLEDALDRLDRLIRLGLTEEMLWEPMSGISIARIVAAKNVNKDNPAEMFEYVNISESKLRSYLPETLSMLDNALDETIQDIMQDISPEDIQRMEPKIGRNAPCPCGSGKKYKKCCINK